MLSSTMIISKLNKSIDYLQSSATSTGTVISGEVTQRGFVFFFSKLHKTLSVIPDVFILLGEKIWIDLRATILWSSCFVPPVDRPDAPAISLQRHLILQAYSVCHSHFGFEISG